MKNKIKIICRIIMCISISVALIYFVYSFTLDWRIEYKIIMSIGTIVALAHIVSLFSQDWDMEYKKVSFNSKKVPIEMNGYQIAFITDTHFMGTDNISDVVHNLNELKINLVVLGGDYASHDGEPDRTMEILSKINATDGIYGVEGNHDNHIELFAAMEKYSIIPLSNSGVHIRDNFYLAGVEDLKNRNSDIAKAVENSKISDLVILLAHNPDIAMKQDTTSVDLILSGHIHGGHITLFGIWAPALTLTKGITKYGQRFMSGWAMSKDNTPVYISNGTGEILGAPRIFARPQVILVTLMHE